jgi:hypothetical protein
MRSLRLAELRRKHGTDLEDDPLPPWLDTYEAFMAQKRPAAPPVVERRPPEPRRNGPIDRAFIEV